MPRAEEQHALDQIEDGYVRSALRASLHVRRYMPFYVFSLIWLVMLAVFPTVRGLAGGSDDLAAGGGLQADGTNQYASEGASATVDASVTTTDGTTAPGATTGSTAAGKAAAGTRTASSASGSGAATSGPAQSVSTSQSIAAALDASGVARSGVECSPGVRQIPLSSYATQCTKKFDAANGNNTFRGVTKDKIRIVRREFPDTANSQAAAAISEQAGFASEDVAESVRDVFIDYFNKSYELYGRTVEWVDYESKNGNSTDEAQSKGREGACADATEIVKELNAFAVLTGSQPFGECAAERQLITFRTAAYFPDKLFRQYHPYMWHQAMDCERIAAQDAEYIGKRLAHRKAKWAGDALLRSRDRSFATYVPDNDGYQYCTDISANLVKNKYKQDPGERYNYQLDLSRFPDQAAQAAVQFKAANATTVILACDPYSVIFLTQAASRQNYFPEWFLIGVALTDTDNLARLYDQSEVDGHMFGMSQLGPTEKLIGPTSEPGRLYQLITGKEIPAGTAGSYFDLVHVYNMLQAAGPALTPDAIGAGAMKIPAGGAPDYPAGYWSFQDGSDGTPGAGDHTAIDDSREVYWVGNARGPDGKAGTFLETYGGKRFRNGEWPAEEPPVYRTS